LEQQLTDAIQTGKETVQHLKRQSRSLSDRLDKTRRANQFLAIELCALLLFLIMFSPLTIRQAKSVRSFLSALYHHLKKPFLPRWANILLQNKVFLFC